MNRSAQKMRLRQYTDVTIRIRTGRNSACRSDTTLMGLVGGDDVLVYITRWTLEV